jgi:hypothetical protein
MHRPISKMASRNRRTLEDVVNSFMNDPDSDDEQFDIGDETDGENADSDWEYNHVDRPPTPRPKVGQKRRAESVSPERHSSPDNSDNNNVAGIVAGSVAGSILLDYRDSSDDFSSEDDVPLARLAGRGWPVVRGGNRRQAPAARWDWNEIQQFQPKDIPFTGLERLKVRMGDNPQPIDFFELYITNETLEHLVTETNRFAAQYLNATQLKPNSLAQDWKDTNLLEMKSFLAVILLMGIVYKPTMNMYWSGEDILDTPIFREAMHRDKKTPNKKGKFAKFDTFFSWFRSKSKKVCYGNINGGKSKKVCYGNYNDGEFRRYQLRMQSPLTMIEDTFPNFHGV